MLASAGERDDMTGRREKRKLTELQMSWRESGMLQEHEQTHVAS
jgi:hypothetical protein